jgi:hypothetical protein
MVPSRDAPQAAVEEVAPVPSAPAAAESEARAAVKPPAPRAARKRAAPEPPRESLTEQDLRALERVLERAAQQRDGDS